MPKTVTPERAREVARQLGHHIPEPHEPATPETIAEIARRHHISADRLHGRSPAAAEHLAASIAQQTQPERISIVPEAAARASLLPTKEQRAAAEQAAKESEGIEQHPDVAAARHAAEDAAVKLADLEQRVIEGDEKVTAQDTGKAREIARFAQLKLAAARRRIRDERDRGRQIRQQDALQAAHKALTQTHGPAALEALRGTALAALADYLTAAVAHNNARDNARQEVQRAGLPKYGTTHEADKAGAHNAVIGWDVVRIGGHDHRDIDLVKLTDEVVRPAAGAAKATGPGGRQIRATAYIH